MSTNLNVKAYDDILGLFILGRFFKKTKKTSQDYILSKHEAHSKLIMGLQTNNSQQMPWFFL